MIYINGIEVLSHVEAEINFTDTANSLPSYVFMDRADAPHERSVCFLQIKNREYNEEDPDNVLNETTGISEHDENKFYLFQFWMFVEDVYSFSYPKNTNLDEQGNPILNEEGYPYITNVGSELVKVQLYELKHYLTKYFIRSNINMYNYLVRHISYGEGSPIYPPIMGAKSTEEIFALFNMDWEACDMPPLVFADLPCEQWKISDLLNLLSINFLARPLALRAEDISEEEISNIRTPDNFDLIPEYFQVWKKRKGVEYRNDITYITSLWPIKSSIRTAEDLETSIKFSSDAENELEHIHRHVCTLVPSKTDDTLDSNHLTYNHDELATYLAEAYVDATAKYEFSTANLPLDFYDSDTWSNISLKYDYGKERLIFFVNKDDISNPESSIFDRYPGKEELFGYYKAQIHSHQPGFIEVVNVMNLQTEETHAGPFQIDVSIPNIAAPGTSVSIKATNKSIQIKPELAYDGNIALNLNVPVMYNGNEVEKIKRTILNFDHVCDDDAINIYEDWSNAPQFEVTSNFNYGNFEEVEYDTLDSTNYNVVLDTSVSSLRMDVTFELKNTLAEVIAWFKTFLTYPGVADGIKVSYQEAMATRWYYLNEIQEITFGTYSYPWRIGFAVNDSVGEIFNAIPADINVSDITNKNYSNAYYTGDKYSLSSSFPATASAIVRPLAFHSDNAGTSLVNQNTAFPPSIYSKELIQFHLSNAYIENHLERFDWKFELTYKS